VNGIDHHVGGRIKAVQVFGNELDMVKDRNFVEREVKMGRGIFDLTP